MKITLTTSFILLNLLCTAQPCTTTGQTPYTALPVCGTKMFIQDVVPVCRGHRLPSPVCKGYFEDRNPFWYKFTCYQSGTLGFIIDPLTDNEDYNWQLYDITGLDPAFVYADSTLVIASNWSLEAGPTGAANEGNPVSIFCVGSTPYSKMPQVIKGHDYLLMVSHEAETQSGYQLYFKDGTAEISDTTKLKIKNAEANCLGNTIRIKLTRKIRCSSVAANGSDFVITPANSNVISANAIGCNQGFETDSIELGLNNSLPLGTYALGVKQGSDGNSLLGFCDDELSGTDKFGFSASTPVPVILAGLEKPKCAPQTLRLILPAPVSCSSIAPDGSDFNVSGSYSVFISGAMTNCNGPSTVTKEIIINLKNPLYRAGNFNLTLRKGTDGNTITNECGLETAEGSSISFTILDTVNADFTYRLFYGCINDTVLFFHPAGNSVNNWQWSLDDGKTSTIQNPQVFYQLFTEKQIHLTVSNGFCTAIRTQFVRLDNYLKADFMVEEDHCPDETIKFTSNAKGVITKHEWSFGDGTSSAAVSPSHVYSAPYTTRVFPVVYTVRNSLGCESTVSRPVKIYSTCTINMSNAFTPNSDGRNDFFYPLNALKAQKLDFRIYNRWGQLLFQTSNWKKGWDGTFNGRPQETGVYVWFLVYDDPDKNTTRQLKGTVALIR
jgi:gliding motility-associated-like protein